MSFVSNMSTEQLITFLKIQRLNPNNNTYVIMKSMEMYFVLILKQIWLNLALVKDLPVNYSHLSKNYETSHFLVMER